MNINFEKANIRHKKIIFKWLDKPHIKEFWDNTLEHREDIIIFMEGRKVKSPYWDDKHSYFYWIGSIDTKPYCMVMTSEIIKSECVKEGSPYTPYLSKTGVTIAIDFMIGEEEYLGKGLASSTLMAFTNFFHEQIDRTCDTFLIDPSETNPRAKRVYEKAGFITVDEYITEEGSFKNQNHFLMVKTIIDKNDENKR